MDNSEILMEMFSRIKKLEARVESLEEELNTKSENVESNKQSTNVNLTQKARDYINQKKSEARTQGLTEIVLICNDIQKALKTTNRAPAICSAMYDCMDIKDEILNAPPSGKSTTVKIKYYL